MLQNCGSSKKNGSQSKDPTPSDDVAPPVDEDNTSDASQETPSDVEKTDANNQASEVQIQQPEVFLPVLEVLDQLSAVHSLYDYKDMRKFESAAEGMNGTRITFVGRINRVSSPLYVQLVNHLDTAYVDRKSLDIDFHSFSKLSDDYKAGDLVLVKAKISHLVVHGKGHYGIAIGGLNLAALSETSPSTETIATYASENGIAKSCLLETISGPRSLVEQKVGNILAAIKASNGRLSLAKLCESGGFVEYTHTQNGISNLTPTITSVRTVY